MKEKTLEKKLYETAVQILDKRQTNGKNGKKRGNIYSYPGLLPGGTFGSTTEKGENQAEHNSCMELGD